MGQSATPIGYALRFGRLEVAKFLVKCGANIDVADEFGVTAREFAMSKGIQLRAVSNLKCNTLTKGNVRKWERDTSTCSQKTE